MQHALSWKKGGFITLRYNHIRNETAELPSQATKDIKIEPVLKSLTGETFEQRTANTSEDARLDISARGFWTKSQIPFIDIRVFDPHAKRYGALSLQRCYINNKKRKEIPV